MFVRCAIIQLALGVSALGQFVPGLLQNGSYWEPGKSEVNFYALDHVQNGQHYPAEVFVTLTPLFLDPSTLVVPETKQPGSLPIIRMNITYALAKGLVPDQGAFTLLWRMDSMSLARATFAGSDGIGTIFKSFQEKREQTGTSWRFICQSHRGRIDDQKASSPNGSAIFWDELPLRVRMLDFSKSSGEFEIQLAPTLSSAACDAPVFKPAKLSFKSSQRNFEVDLKHENGIDHFILDHDFPFLLREWKMADGSSLKMKNSIRAAYETYSKPGDRERALKDTMLRHPD